MAKQEEQEPWIDGEATYENVEKALQVGKDGFPRGCPAQNPGPMWLG